MSPTMRDDTVTKKKPNTMMSSEAIQLPCVGIPGVTARNTASRSEPASTIVIGMSRSVRVRATADAARAEVLHAVAERRDDGRDGAAERDQPGREHGAGADVADVRAPDLARRHLREEQPACRNGRERHRHVVAGDRQERQQHHPREHAACEHDAGNPRADDVADAHVLRRDVHVQGGVREDAGPRHGVADGGAEDLEDPRERLPEGADAQPDEHRSRERSRRARPRRARRRRPCPRGTAARRVP